MMRASLLQDDRGISYPAEDEAGIAVRFAPRARERAQDYFGQRRGRGHRPPAGQAKKRYALGHRMAEVVRAEPVPAELRTLIGQPPLGYRYVIVDGDLVKVAVGTGIVVDVVEGLVR